MSCLVLIHSPLVGPSTWEWVADELRSGGDDVIIPTISEASFTGGWRSVVAEMATQVVGANNAVFVAHSGAGLLLPRIVKQANVIDPMLVFVDAGFPFLDRDTPVLPTELLTEIAVLAQQGILPPWSEWFGSATMSILIPDRERRAAVVSDIPKLPLQYFSESIPPTATWPAARNRFLLLSEAYREEATEARRRGWPVLEVLGQHLDMVSNPHAIVEAINWCRAVA